MIGINYGRLGDNLLIVSEIVILIKNLGIGRVWIFDYDGLIIKVFVGLGLEFIIGMGNDEIFVFVKDVSVVDVWVVVNVVLYYFVINIVYIMVGNEFFVD